MDWERKESRMPSRFMVHKIRRRVTQFTEIVKTVGGTGFRMKIRNLFHDILSWICLLEVRAELSRRQLDTYV